MNENIHNDDLFRKAYQSFEEEPSPDVWDKLNAHLDKKDAIYYRSRFAWWRNIAVMLTLLLGSVVTYELFVHSKAHNEANTAIKNAETDQSLEEATGLKQNSADSNDLKNTVTENDKTGLNEKRAIKQGNDQKLNKLPGKKQSFNSQKLIPANEANEKENVEIPIIASDAKADSSSENIQSTTGDATNMAVIEKENNNPTDSSGYAVAELTTGDSINQLTAPADKKTIRLTGVPGTRWSFSPFASIGFTGQHLDNDNAHSEPTEPNERDEINEREHHELSYSLGIFARYHFTRHLNVKAGLLYSKVSTGIQPQTLHTSAANDHNGYKFVTSSGYAYVPKAFGTTPSAGDSIYAENAEHHISYLDIPLMAGYTVNPAKRFTIRPGAGITTHIFLGSKAETEIKKGNEAEHIFLTNFKGQSPVYFSFAGDVELNYRLNKKLNLMFSPSFNYAINSITNKNVVKTYPYSLKFGAGITWELND